MSGLWLLGYVLLWGIVALMGLLLLGLLRQVGALNLRLAQPHGAHETDAAGHAGAMPPLEQDGPVFGSPLPAWAGDVAGWTDESDAGGGAAEASTLLMFLSPLCETCQHVVEPLNELAADTDCGVRPAAIIRADRMAYEAFLNVFPLHLPTLRDSDRTLTMELGVHRAPFGLLYDRDGRLVAKGLIEDGDDLMALIGAAPDETLGEASRAKIVRRAEPALR
jgi:hypothetical protein